MIESRFSSADTEIRSVPQVLRQPRATVPVPRQVAPNLGRPAATFRIRPLGTTESRARGADASSGVRVCTHGADDVTVMCVEGVLDMLSAPMLAENIATVLLTHPRAVVIDMTDLEFLSAAGLEVLASAHRAAGSRTRLAVVAASRAIRRPIQLTGINETLPMHSTLAAAVLTSSAVSTDESVLLR